MLALPKCFLSLVIVVVQIFSRITSAGRPVSIGQGQLPLAAHRDSRLSLVQSSSNDDILTKKQRNLTKPRRANLITSIPIGESRRSQISRDGSWSRWLPGSLARASTNSNRRDAPTDLDTPSTTTSKVRRFRSRLTSRTNYLKVSPCDNGVKHGPMLPRRHSRNRPN